MPIAHLWGFDSVGRPREEVIADVRDRISNIPGAAVNIGQPISHRLDHLLSGVRAQIAVKLFGNDLDQLRAKAAEIQGAMGAVPGVVDLQTEKQVLVPQLRIEGDRAALARYGLNVGDLNQALETALNGRVVSQVLEGQRTFDLLVRFDDPSRNSLEAIRGALIGTSADLA